jgi:hypothetical protein
VVETIRKSTTYDDRALTIAWWQEVREYTDNFFDASACFEADAYIAVTDGLLMDMEIALNSVFDVPFPPSVSTTRRSLLEAMWNILTARKASLHGQDKMAANYLGVARRHWQQFEKDISDFSVS